MGLSIALHGGPGMGKTTLAATAPGPRLHIDTEGGNEWLAGKVTPWTDLGKLPEGIDEATTVTVNVSGDHAIEIFQAIYQWLMSGKHPFNSVILDSLSEMQQRIIDKQTPIGAGDPDWVSVVRIMSKMIRDLKDLKNHPVKPLQAIIFICGTDQKMSDKRVIAIQPALTGQLATKLPHFVDVCGYTTLVWDTENQSHVQYLQILPMDDVLKVKDRTSPPGRVGLSSTYGPTIVNPNIITMLQVVNQAQAVA